MNISYELVKNKNKKFDGKAIKYYEELKHKLSKAIKAIDFKKIPNEESNGAPPPAGILRTIKAMTELEQVANEINSKLVTSREKLKVLREEPEFVQEIHLKSERVWNIIPEYFNEETGKTEYGNNDSSNYITDKEDLNKFTEGRYRFNGKAEPFKVDVLLPYSKDVNIKIKDAVKEAQDKALERLKEYRKTRRAIPFKEKELSRQLKLLEGMPEEFTPSYKVYAGGGYGEQTEDGKFGNEKYFIHMEKGTFMKLAQVGKLRRVFEAKKPRTRDHHVGVEIEFVSKFNKYELAQLLYQNDVHEFVQLVQDHSLRPEKEYQFTHELTVLAPEQMIHAVLARVLKAINDKDGSRVAKRCGLHVHLDMRNRDRKRCFTNLSKAQTIMYAMNPASRVSGIQADGKTKDVVYSKRLEVDDIDEAIAICNRTSGAESRYFGINPLALDRHQTLEIRIHSGSTNFEKISNWVKMLTAIVNSDVTVKKEFTKAEDFCEHYKLDSGMVKYINERIAKFKDKNGKHITLDEAC
jgi:hypothetical protein